MSIVNQTKAKMQATIEHFKQDMKSLRTNRANPGILDGVIVEAYGASMRIKELATVTTPEARQILITPFDPKTAGMIAKGIEKANLGLQAIHDGNVVRVMVPPMDEAMRKEIVKQGKKKVEDAKVAIREVRRKNNDFIRKQKADGEIPEDVMKKTEKAIQELTDDFCKEIDTLFAAKEKEVLTV